MDFQDCFFNDESLFEVREMGGTKPPVIRGYAAVFEKPSRPLRQGTRQFVEIIERGAFDQTDFSDTDARFNHDKGRTLATYPNTLRLGVDSRGLWYEFDIDRADPDHVAVLAKINRRDVTGSSFQFAAMPSGETWKRLADGTFERRLQKIPKTFDVGPVSRPAYVDTSVFSRSLDAADAPALPEISDAQKAVLAEIAAIKSKIGND